MTVEIWRSIVIDRISMLVTITSDELYKVLYGQLYGMRDEREKILPGGHIQVRFDKVKYTTRLDYYPEFTKMKGGKRKIADITIGKNKKTGQETLNRHLTLTLYPSKFKHGEFERLKEIIDIFFQEFGYAAFFNYGKVNYLELAWDSKSQINHSFLPYKKGLSLSSIFLEKDGNRGTLYLGSSKSPSSSRIYDKLKKIIADGLTPNSKAPHTRFEFVQRRLGISTCELGKIENPFTKLKIGDLCKVKALYVDSEWPVFLANCESMGVPQALPSIKSNQARRKKYIAALNSIPVPWWKPHNAWRRFPEALLKIAP